MKYSISNIFTPGVTLQQQNCNTLQSTIDNIILGVDSSLRPSFYAPNATSNINQTQAFINAVSTNQVI